MWSEKVEPTCKGFGGGAWTDWKHTDISTQTWSLRAQGQRRMNGLKMRLHQHRGSALSAPVHGKYLPGAITSRLLPTTLRSCIKTSSWPLRPNAESTTASLFFTQLILRRSM